MTRDNWVILLFRDMANVCSGPTTINQHQSISGHSSAKFSGACAVLQCFERHGYIHGDAVSPEDDIESTADWHHDAQEPRKVMT